MTKRVGYFIIVLLFLFKSSNAQLTAKVIKDTLSFSIKPTPLLQNYYTSHLSFFCRQELQLQKITGANLFLRLGSKEYVDYLEQKPNAVRRY